MTLSDDQRRTIMMFRKSAYLESIAKDLIRAMDTATAKYQREAQLPIFHGRDGWDNGPFVFTPILLAKGDEFDLNGRRWVMRWAKDSGSGLWQYEVDEVGVYEHEPIWHDTVNPDSQYCTVCGRWNDRGPRHGDFLIGEPKDFLDDNWYSRKTN